MGDKDQTVGASPIIRTGKKVHGPYGWECQHERPGDSTWVHPAETACPELSLKLEPLPSYPILDPETVADFANSNDPVKKPSHYTSHPSGIECWDVTRHMNFNLGNAMKYIWRCDLKDNPIQDLEKAIEYIQDEIAMRKSDRHEQ